MARFKEGSVVDFINTCVNIPRYFALCKECPCFNKRWSCPPYSFSVEDFWNCFSDILLYEEKVLITPEIQAKDYTHDEIVSIRRHILAPVKRRMTDYLLALEAQNPGTKALFAGSCDFCEICSKEKGEPCRNPNLMRYSIESLGGDVSLAAQVYFDDIILWEKDGHLPAYYILLGALLK